jgi:hypothetical protein
MLQSQLNVYGVILRLTSCSNCCAGHCVFTNNYINDGAHSLRV